MEVARDLPGYQTVAFPPCTCSLRNDGFVIPRITYNFLELSASTANGIQEVKLSLMLHFTFGVF